MPKIQLGVFWRWRDKRIEHIRGMVNKSPYITKSDINKLTGDPLPRVGAAIARLGFLAAYQERGGLVRCEAEAVLRDLYARDRPTRRERQSRTGSNASLVRARQGSSLAEPTDTPSLDELGIVRRRYRQS